MTGACKPIPDGYHTITPYLATPKVAEVVEFLVKTFGATEGHRSTRADGSVMHTDVVVGDSHVMLGEPQGADFPPMPASIYAYVENSDEVFARAVEAGGEVVMPIQTMHFSGQRYGGVRDPGGNIWWIATQVEEVSPEEEERRAREMGIGQ